MQLFKSKVVDSVKLCNSHLFDQPKIDDPYAIRLVNCPFHILVLTTIRKKVCVFVKTLEGKNYLVFGSPL